MNPASHEWDWVPLLQELSSSDASIAVIKHLDRALAGIGDIDAAVPKDSWDRITKAITEWVFDQCKIDHAIICDHVPGIRAIFLIGDVWLPQVWQFDLIASYSRLGRAWGHADDFLSLSSLDDRGIRRVRAGGEALALMMTSVMHHGADFEAPIHDRAVIEDAVRCDPAGLVMATSRLIPWPARAPADQFVADLVAGNWNRSLMDRVLAAFAAGAVIRPVHSAKRLCHRVAKGCSLSEFRRTGRLLSVEPIGEFLSHAASDHDVVSR